MSLQQILFAVILIGLGTYLFRAGSLSLGSRVKWPDWAKRWLDQVTPAILGALLAPLILTNQSQLVVPWNNAGLIALVPTGFVAWKTKHLLWTVSTGIVSYAIILYFIHG